MILHLADRRRPGDETILIVMTTRAVEIREEAELRGVTFEEEILPKNIRDLDLLIARIECRSGPNRYPSPASGRQQGCTASGCCRNCRRCATPRLASLKMKPRKSLTNG